MESVEGDDVFQAVGQFGLFQKRVVLIVSLVSFSTAFNNLGYVFWAARPAWHHCLPSDSSLDDDLNITVPWDTVSDPPVRSRSSVKLITCSLKIMVRNRSFL